MIYTLVIWQHSNVESEPAFVKFSQEYVWNKWGKYLIPIALLDHAEWGMLLLIDTKLWCVCGSPFKIHLIHFMSYHTIHIGIVVISGTEDSSEAAGPF